MELDLPTLMAVEAFIVAISSLTLIAACPAGPDSRGRWWWVTGGLTMTLALALILVGFARSSDTFAVAANIIFCLSAAFYWTGARVFSGRRPVYPLIAAGSLAFAALCYLPPLAAADTVLPEINLGLTAAYLLAGGFEFATSRERLFARLPLAILFFLHGFLLAFGSVESIFQELPFLKLVALLSWFGAIHFESIIFSTGTTAFAIVLVRSRAEMRHRLVAESDGLTGVMTRRAFFEAGVPAVAGHKGKHLPVAVAVVDLDHFKSINDRFGHAMGDAVLKRFGELARSMLRDGDLVGRLGGEEFALLLPETGLPQALEIVERLRAAFEAEGAVIDGVAVGATLSAGVATGSPDSTLDAMLGNADEALYAAKARGRNQVERAPSRRDGRPALTRVA
ncbi:MAG: GGDEF domain-containing protein [Bauldia sp.]|nr:GGDEF domain-containing protein [Bauldia sp.]